MLQLQRDSNRKLTLSKILDPSAPRQQVEQAQGQERSFFLGRRDVSPDSLSGLCHALAAGTMFEGSIRVLVLLVAVLIWKVTLNIAFEYRNYVPPNFESDFLRGREAYFWGAYGWAFYLHLISGPPSLILGTVLVSERMRRRSPAWHRRLGRLQVALVLLIVAPSFGMRTLVRVVVHRYASRN